uniref:Ig-like domain-containing protein n=1 Tax=Amphiprion percula TaxID=161767 RepID=A0A3P8TMQ6_AMPPE
MRQSSLSVRLSHFPIGGLHYITLVFSVLGTIVKSSLCETLFSFGAYSRTHASGSGLLRVHFINLKNLVCSTVKHSFSGIFTASTGTSNLPEVVAVALVNNIEASYCDSKIEKAIPKQDWMENLRDGEPEYWKEYAQDCAVNRLFFEEQFHILKRRLNQTTSVHILQKVIGCEWDDKTETSHGYQNYGFDGEDFLVFDLKTLTWIATKPQAVITKHYWDRQKTTNDLWKYYLTQVCVDWLKKHLKYGRISLMRTDLPSVSLLQKTPSSQVTCHATGFYPDRADLFWRKDGEELHEDVDKGEILPNHDGTFQMSVDLNISSIAAEDWKKYDCVFQMSDVKDDIITKLDKSVIRTNQTLLVLTFSLDDVTNSD